MNNNTRKILMVANHRPGIGGISRMVDNLTAGLKKEGFSVRLHSTAGSWPARLLAFAKMIPLSRKCDIIHAHGSSGWGFIPAFAGTLAGFMTKTPVIATYHGSVKRSRSFVPYNPMTRFVAKKAFHITTPFETTALPFQNLGGRASSIPNVFDAKKWTYRKRDRITPKFIWTRNTYHPELAVGAFIKIKEHYREAELVMCGYGATPQKLGRHGNEPGLILRGYVPHDRLPPLLDQADIYLNTQSEDSFGYSIYEAMAMGLSVVSVESESLRHYVGDDIIAFAKREDAESLAEAAMILLGDAALTESKRQQGRARLDSFSWDAVKQPWMKIYQAAGILGRHDRRPLKRAV